MTENSDFWFDYDRTPRDVTDMNGRRLEIGEEPVKVTVFAPGFGRKYPWGHVQMEYEGLVIDFEAGGMRNLKADQPQIFEEGVRHYYVFPAAAGISRERLREAILRRRGQAGDYSLLSNNCADQVRTVMEEAGARGIKEFGPLEISVPERIGGWCAGRGVEIDVHTTNLYRLERRKDFGRLKRMLAYSKRLLAGEYAVEGWLPDGGSGEQMRDFMVRRAVQEIRRIVRTNSNDFGTGKVFVDYLTEKCGESSFLEQYGIAGEMRRTAYLRHPEREAWYLARREGPGGFRNVKNDGRS